MKNRTRTTIKYSYLTAALFVLVIFSCAFINLKEVAMNYIGGNTKSVREIAADAESVDLIVYPFINLNGAFQNVMQRDYIYDADPSNDTIRKSSGYLVSVPSGYDDEDVLAAADTLKASSDWLDRMGIPLVYVQAPSKMSYSPDGAMPGITNYTYSKNALFRERAESLGIDYIDSAEWMTGTDEDFYRTDHHWTTGSCLTVAAGICGHLRDEYSLKADESAADPDNYEVTIHEKAFLGAEGRRTGIWYTGLDDFAEIIPKFSTGFDITISDKDGNITERSGSFEEAVMDMTKDVSKYSFDDSAYYEYWGGDYGRIHAVNRQVTDAPRVLVFKDSYGVPVTAFLAGAFSEMDIVDLRYYSEDQSIAELIETARPDAVVYIYGTGYLSRSSMFSIK